MDRIEYFRQLKDSWEARVAGFPEYRGKYDPVAKLSKRGVDAFMNYASGFGAAGPDAFKSDGLWFLISVRGPRELYEFLAKQEVEA